MRPLLPFIALGLALGCFVGFTPSASAKVTSNEIRSIVRIEVPVPLGASTSSGSGVMIDQDGRFLTSYSAVAKLVKDKLTKATVCLAKDEFSLPTCNLEAVLVKADSGRNLALLQVKRVLSQGEWRSVEEEKLRNGFSFSYVKLSKTSSTESIGLSDGVSILDYTLNTQSSLTQHTGQVAGFERKSVTATSSVPWFVKTDITASQKSAGGAVLNDQNELIGIPTMAANTTNGYAVFISLPVVNSFLKEVLSANYINNKIPFVFDGDFVGKHGGSFAGTVCPESSQYDSRSKICTCNNGFFAVGNACIPGSNYCQAVYPKGASYDVFLKQCLCLVNGETRICTDNLRKIITPAKPAAPKPATSTSATTPTSTKVVAPVGKATSTKPVVVKATSTPAVKPAVKTTTSTPSIVEVACKKKTGWSYLKKTNTCVPVGKLVKQADLALCNIVAVPATKWYFLKGNSFIKRMTFRNKECFADEASALKAKYKKSLTK